MCWLGYVDRLYSVSDKGELIGKENIRECLDGDGRVRNWVPEAWKYVNEKIKVIVNKLRNVRRRKQSMFF